LTSRDHLRLTVQADSDGTGQLSVEISAAGFAGVGSAWFDLQGLEDFARSLEAFPLPAVNPPTLEGGFWRNDGKGLEQRHVRLIFQPANRRGTVGVRVELATPSWEGDRPESQKELGLDVYTDYASLQRFATDFAHLARGELPEAVLWVGENRH
jgi:hypothetical protein